MRGPEHYRRAEQALTEAHRCKNPDATRVWLQTAAIHAQLAHTAAMVGLADEDDDRAWRGVLGPAAEAPAGELMTSCGLRCPGWAGPGTRCIRPARPGEDRHGPEHVTPRLPSTDALRWPVDASLCACGHRRDEHITRAGGTAGRCDADGPQACGCQAWQPLVPGEDTCGQLADGGRCVLRPGHDEPCLPYRAPAATRETGTGWPGDAPPGPASHGDGDLGPVTP